MAKQRNASKPTTVKLNTDRPNRKAWKKNPKQSVSKGGVAGYSRNRIAAMAIEQGTTHSEMADKLRADRVSKKHVGGMKRRENPKQKQDIALRKLLWG